MGRRIENCSGITLGSEIGEIFEIFTSYDFESLRWHLSATQISINAIFAPRFVTKNEREN